MTIYIISSNNSIHSIEALQYSINKYWPGKPDVVVLSYDHPKNFILNENVRVDSMGQDRGHNHVCENLITYFNNVEESHFIFSCDDFPLIRPVNIEMFETLKQKMLDENISRVAMNGHVKTKPYNIIEQYDNYKDNLTKEEYFYMTKKWIYEFYRITKHHIFYNIQEVKGNKGIIKFIYQEYSDKIKEVFDILFECFIQIQIIEFEK